MTPRKVYVTLTLWTDAESDQLQSIQNWEQLLHGDNPSWADMGREPLFRVFATKLTVPGQFKKKAKPTKKKAKRKKVRARLKPLV